MKNQIYTGVVLASLILLAGSRVLQGQETFEPPLRMVVPGLPALRDDLFGEGRSWLGVRLADVTAEKVQGLKLSGEYGAIVITVEENSPAGKSGLAKNDVILEFNGERVWSVAHLQRLVVETPPGRAVTIKISRAGQARALTVQLEARERREPGEQRMFSQRVPMPDMRAFNFDFPVFGPGPSLGILGEDLTPQLAEYFGVKQARGVLVREVVVGSAAEKAGLKAGDVIVKVDGTEVGSPSELRRALSRDPDEKRKVAVTLVRDRREQTLEVELEPMDRRPIRHV